MNYFIETLAMRRRGQRSWNQFTILREYTLYAHLGKFPHIFLTSCPPILACYYFQNGCMPSVSSFGAMSFQNGPQIQLVGFFWYLYFLAPVHDIVLTLYVCFRSMIICRFSFDVLYIYSDSACFYEYNVLVECCYYS